MADPNQTPDRPEWACPCSGCSKAVAYERKSLLALIEKEQLDSVSPEYIEGLSYVYNLIQSRMPKKK